MQTEHVIAGQVTDLPVDLIFRSLTNPRTHFDEKALNELAQSIASQGVLEPIIVRPHPQEQSKFELVAGERRWLASQRAKKDTVPSIIRELSDRQAREIQTIENLQREQLHPIEEAKNYASLMEFDPETYTVEEIALRVGRKHEYVYHRLQLLKLIDDAQLLFAGDRLPITHAMELARLQPAHQQQAMQRCFRDFKSAEGVLKDKHRTVELGLRELREWIKSQCLLDLKTAPFDVADKDLVASAGACTDCPKRAGNNPMLFADIAKGNRCVDPLCYEAKKQRLVQIRIDEHTGAGMKTVRLSDSYRMGNKEERKDTFYRNEFWIVKAGSCPLTQPGIYVDGPEFGKQIFVCTSKDCRSHDGRSSYSSLEKQKARKEQLQRQKIEKTFRWALIGAVKKKLPKVHKQDDLLMVVLSLNRSMGHDNRRRVFKVYGWEEKKSQGKYGGSYVDYEGLAAKHIEKMSGAELIQFLILSTLAHDLLIPGYDQEQPLAATAGLAQIAKRYGIDVKEIRSKSAHAAKPAKRVH